jgi:hypothetical protein
MKLKGAITILVSRDGISIEIEDRNANTTFLKVEMTPEEFTAAIGRQAYCDCTLEVRGLDRVGKKHECNTFEFTYDDKNGKRPSDKELGEIAQSQLSDGWIAESYFGSQNSFFVQDGIKYARCTIRRYV